MRAFRAPMNELGEIDEIRRALRRNTGLIQITGCIDSQKSHLIDTLSADAPLRVIVAANSLRAREIYDNYKLFDRSVMLFPAKDFIFFQADVQSGLIRQQRLGVLRALAEGKCSTLVLTVTGLMNHMMSLKNWKEEIFSVRVGEELDLEESKARLMALGYERSAQAEVPGQFAVRGGIIDLYPMTEETGLRIELWGDEVDSIRSFDPETQRSLENLEEAVIYPAAELILTRERREDALRRIRSDGEKMQQKLAADGKTEAAHRLKLHTQDCVDALSELGSISRAEELLEYLYPYTVSVLDFIGGHAMIFLDEPNRMQEAALSAEEEFRESMRSRLENGYILPGQTDILFSESAVTAMLGRYCCVGLCMLENVRGGWDVTGKFALTVHAVSPYNSSFELLIKDLLQWKKKGYRIILLSASHSRGQRLAKDLLDRDLNAFYTEDEEREVQPGEILVTYGNAHRGYEYPLIKFAVLCESDIFGKEKKKPRRAQKVYEGRKINSFLELSPGDYVVHESHGLGIYRGLEQITVNHVQKDYMKIEYADGGNLYVVASQLNVIQKYAGADAKTPKLNRLGTPEWNRTKTRVRHAVREIAAELVALYAARQQKEGFVYGPDTVWQREFEEMFPFEETEDQIHAIEETKKDMESPKIMDRLICGDVGYGKTEIALRAAFKAVQEERQVAYLVPTTILAQQHYNTFVQRMKDFPVRVDLLCRFRSPAEQKKTVEDLKKGLVDIVIGTHRILSKDVGFRQLGLLIVDEEQRFGVTHKEKIKQMKKDVDVLTLTATPIPRTLHMSLIGIRDMSVLEEAPSDRLPIQTFVMEYNEELVREAILRELAREGQVYYVYNRVNTIMDLTARIQKLVPQARVAFAHGQMKERELEGIMYDFINGDIDVLISTTIVETGLDIPNANTMIIHDADTMGLAQLYQLRGRIGRSSRTAFAFLMYRRNKMLREVAEKRLAAIREFTELGSGFRIAMRDLEIRGAGNLLGSEQHGHMDAVGYDLYCKLLNESVRELKGEATPQEAYETVIDLDVDAYIPDRYIRSEEQKLDLYKRIASIASEEEEDDMLDELLDRFGEPPKAVRDLLSISLLREMAHQVYLTEVTQNGDEIRFLFYEKAQIDVTKIDDFIRSFSGRMSLRAEKTPYLSYQRAKRAGKAEDVLHVTREILLKMRELLQT